MPNVSTNTPDLMGLVSRQFTPEVIQRAAAELGEDRERTAKAVSASVPSVLTALSDVASSPTGATHIEDVIEQTRRSGARMGDGGQVLGTAGATEAGTRLFDDELGAKSSSISEAVAGSSGITRDSAHKLLGGVTSATLLTLGKNMLGASALRSASREQRGEWVRRLPGPLASLFGASGYSAATTAPVIEHERERVTTGPAIRTLPSPRRNWLLPLALAALALLGYSMLRGLRRPTVERMTPNVTQAVPQPQRHVATPPAAPTVRAPFRLPNGQTLALVPGSGIQQFASFLGGPDQTVPQRFALTPLNFESDTAMVTPESMSNVNDIASLLKAYPSTGIAVASYTDNVGEADANLALSTARSEAIRNLLVARGVDASRIEAVGFGQDHPIASNDTVEGRAKNRRAEIVVTRK